MLPRLLVLVATCLVLAGCGSDDTPVATDPASSSASPTESPTEPTAPPTVGTYPSFAPQDYAYTLRVSCFCADAGAPVRITVVGGEVTDAVYLAGGRGVTEGDQAPDFRRLTIDDVIEAANDTDAARVDVTWPADQDHPSSVYVDQDTRMADEEVGYEVSDVVVG